MWQPKIEVLEAGRIRRITVARGPSPMSHAEVIEGWKSSSEFRAFYIALLADSPFDAMFWESLPITPASIDRPHEFVLVNSPASATATPDTAAFAAAFSVREAWRRCAARHALSAGPACVYPHLAAFRSCAARPRRSAMSCFASWRK